MMKHSRLATALRLSAGLGTPVSRFALAAAVLTVLAGTAALSGCKPDYPSCETDKDCKAKEFCLARKCQQCRQDSDCGEGNECQGGKCSAIVGFCKATTDCAPGQSCIANRCRACQADSECPSGLRCLAGSCAKPQCNKDDDCPQDKDCVKGVCTAAAPKTPVGPSCSLAPVYFGFDEVTLSSEATGILASNLACLKQADRPVNVVGRCDPRGTDEYNLALSERRANAVKDHLKRLGVDAGRLRVVPRGALDAKGTDDAGWAKDRRADFEWQ